MTSSSRLCVSCTAGLHESCSAYREENTVAALAGVLGLGPTVCDCECDSTYGTEDWHD